MKLGVIGTGTIAAAIVEGLDKAGERPPTIVSPRNADIAAMLAARFGHVRIAQTNQQVLNESDIVILAVRPQVAADVLSGLRFRADQLVLSLIATVTLDWLRSAVAPALRVVRAVPLPSVARCEGPTAFFPADDVVKRLFDRLGVAIALDQESAFDAFTAVTALMASHFAFAEAATAWMTRNGVPPDQARPYVAAILRGLAGTAAAHPDRSFARLADEHATKGGLNEQARLFLAAAGQFGKIGEALDAILRRLRA